MNAEKQDANERVDVQIEATDCPECGTNWEVVVTERRHEKPATARKE